MENVMEVNEVTGKVVAEETRHLIADIHKLIKELRKISISRNIWVQFPTILLTQNWVGGIN